jgi:PAS domain-containing protein
MTIVLDEAPNSDRAQECDLLAQMVEQAPSIMAFVREPSHRVVMANKAFRQLFGEEIVEKTAIEVPATNCPHSHRKAGSGLSISDSAGLFRRRGTYFPT